LQLHDQKSVFPMADSPPLASSLTVRLQVRVGAGRPTAYEVGDGGFLIGTVPGCDLRVPGSKLAPVLCLISRHAAGASLRKLAPVLPILVNSRAVSGAPLRDGDRISVGGAEIAVAIETPAGADLSLDERLVQLEERERTQREQEQRLEEDRATWNIRRQDIEAECRRQGQTLQEVVQRLRQQELALDTARTELEAREQVWRSGQAELAAARAELQANRDQASLQQEEVRTLRRELTDVRQQLYERYRARRDRLASHHQAVRRAARKVQERKRTLDAAEVALRAREEEAALRLSEIEGGTEQVRRERQLLEDQHRLMASRQQELQRDLGERLADVQDRERKLSEATAILEKGQKQHQTDLVRLDRIQAMIEQRLKRLQNTALEVDRRYEQLQRDSRDLEEQAAQLDEWHNRLAADSERLAEQKKAHDAASSQIDQRAASLEGQQAMLATLRTRIERLREDLHRQEQELSDQRALQEAGERDLRQRLTETERLRSELDNDRQLFAQERLRFEGQRATMESAVTQLRMAQDALAVEHQEFRRRAEEVDARAAEQSEQMALLAARTTQLGEQEARLTADREALREREAALARAGQALAALQEQVRRRSEELAEKLRDQAAQEQRLSEEATASESRRRTAEQDEQLARERLELSRQEIAARAAELEARTLELARREEGLTQERERLEESQQSLAIQRQTLASERLAWEVEKQQTQSDAERTRVELEVARVAAKELADQLPELEARAAEALGRLAQGREQLRESLAEMHAYARQAREDLDAGRGQLQTEAERLRRVELDLQTARDEHRLQVAAYRQQLIEWQGRVSEMRTALAQGETRLDRRQAEVEAQAQELASASARLAEQAELLQRQQQLVAERRGEVDRHLADMREWYRRKLRELAGLEPPRGALPEDDSTDARERGILTLTSEVEPGDRQLGELLRSLELIDADTLAALLLEARRQRRTLRQVLLAGNYLTLYQIALIEAGNLDGLVLGPVRVIDRLQATPREAVYRVFDPRRNAEALLRHLAESEMDDAVRPDEFRQRFAAAAVVRHPNVAATLQVLDIAGRPAVLQEWVQGVPSTEWPALAAAPGVWFRLASQAALALHTIHAAGIVHGHLHAASFVFTPEGLLKLCSAGEPRWLAVPPPQEEEGEPSPHADVRALGHIAAGWATAAAGGKVKPLPEALQEVVRRCATAGYASTQELLDDLDRASTAVPANAAAWERFIRQVREESSAAVLRQSA
jgi:chromosome segregation ATPase